MTNATNAFYPYIQYGEGTGGATAAAATAATGGYISGQGYGLQYPHHLFQYPAATGGYAQQYGAPISLATAPALQSAGMCFIEHISFFVIQISGILFYVAF